MTNDIGKFLGLVLIVSLLISSGITRSYAQSPETRTYDNRLRLLENPEPLLADHPEFIEPIVELRRYEAQILVDDEGGDLEVRAWRYSYNARGIIEMPNRLRSDQTAVIMVHPWGIDDGQGWQTPEPAGAADFCTPEKNHLAGRHTREVIDPLLKRLRQRVKLTMVSLLGHEYPAQKKLYRSIRHNPSIEERVAGKKELDQILRSFDYRGQPLRQTLKLSRDLPVVDYFKEFPGLQAGDRFNNKGFWKMPIPVSADVTMHRDDVVIYDADGYEVLKDFLKEHGVRHILLTGYATDICFCKTTAGYQNLSKDFNVFLVGDATLATFPANATPKYATNAHISFASINQLITQTSWIRFSDSR